MRLGWIILLTPMLVACSPPSGQDTVGMTLAPVIAVAPPRSADEIVRAFAEAWRGEEEFRLNRPTTLGIWVDGEGYAVQLTNEGASFLATAPARFDWGFETELETLQRLDNGSLNALTAMGQARASDAIPLDLRLPDDFSEEELIRSYYIPLTLRFWNREWPETIPFGDGVTRSVHGANTTVLIYDEGLRSAWYQLKAGMHVNADPADQVNDFDSAIIVTRGYFSGVIGGTERAFREGETVIVPAGTSHEFFADENEYGEFIILMWGDGA